MTANRRLRLLRLRGFEHQIAALGVARADAALANVTAIETRVARLRAGTSAEPGMTSGRALQTLAELAMRLDSAGDGLAISRARAAGDRAARELERTAAHRAEERAARLHQTASGREAAERERSVVALPPRKRKARTC